MDCTSDINDIPVFVRPSPATRVVPDDYRLQTGSARGNLHRSSSANRLCLVPVRCGRTQRCCSHETRSTLCFGRSNCTRSLLSIAEFDSQHSNLDAHGFESQPTDLCYAKDPGEWILFAGNKPISTVPSPIWVEREFVVGCHGSKKKVCASMVWW
jgi:hypothetical protein